MSADETRSVNVERQIFLRTLQIATGPDREPLQGVANTLAQLMRDVYFTAGSVLYRAGEPCDYLYFIVRGEVQLVAPNLEPFRFAERSAVGILDMLRDQAHERTALAVTNVEALSIRAEDWLEMLEENYEYARSAMVGVSTSMLALAKDLPRRGFPEGTEAPPPESRLVSRSLAPGAPTGALDLVGRILVLRDVPAFSMVRIQAFSSMAEVAEEISLSQGDVLFHEGDAPRAVYVVVRGTVELQGPALPYPIGFGSRRVVGAYAAFSHKPRPWTARAASAATLLRLRNEDLFDLMEIHFEIARSVMAYLATQRVRIMTERAELAAAEPAISAVSPVTTLPVGA